MTTDFGCDLWCLDDIDAMGREVTGVDVVVQRLYRRLSTPTGGLIDAPDEGLDLRGEVNDDLDSEVGLAALRSRIIAEALRDEAVLSLTVTGSFDPRARLLRLRLRGVADVGPFEFVLQASSVTLELLT